MENAGAIISSLIAGILLGGIFFGGLWLTVSKALRTGSAWIWFVLSFVVRIAVAAVGFYYLSDGHWDRLVAGLAGFLLVRVVFTRIIGSGGRALGSAKENKQ